MNGYLKDDIKDMLEEAMGAAIWEKYSVKDLMEEFGLSEKMATDIWERAKLTKIKMGISEWLG